MPLIFELYKVQLKMNIKQHIIKDDVLLMPLIFELYKVQLKNVNFVCLFLEYQQRQSLCPI